MSYWNALVKSLTANSKLRYAIGADNTVIESQPGEGTLFPTSGTYYIVLGSDNPATAEIVTCTSVTDDAFTVTRGTGGTTARAHVAGELFEMLVPYFLNTDLTYSLPSGQDLDLPAGVVDKADLATGVYQEVKLTLAGSTNDFDTQTVILDQLWSVATVIQVAYFTSGAIGTGVGIDIVDGSTNGAGTDVIDSCSDNLNGSDVNPLTTPYALSAGDYINVTFDNVDASIDFTIVITLKVALVSAT